MESVVGVFQSADDVRRALELLQEIHIDRNHTTILWPGDENAPQRMTAIDNQSTRPGEALGGTVGGALGVAGGATLGAAVASLFVPGVGTIVVAGVLAAALLGTGGALVGAAVGDALEHGLVRGIPDDELYLYESALRQGRTVFLVSAEGQHIARKVQEVFRHVGAADLAAVREDWWLGLREGQQKIYETQGGDFSRDEPEYRRGFELALRPELRGKSLDDVAEAIRRSASGDPASSAFRAGYDRGQAHQRDLLARTRPPEKVIAHSGS